MAETWEEVIKLRSLIGSPPLTSSQLHDALQLGLWFCFSISFPLLSPSHLNQTVLVWNSTCPTANTVKFWSCSHVELPCLHYHPSSVRRNSLLLRLKRSVPLFFSFWWRSRKQLWTKPCVLGITGFQSGRRTSATDSNCGGLHTYFRTIMYEMVLYFSIQWNFMGKTNRILYYISDIHVWKQMFTYMYNLDQSS